MYNVTMTCLGICIMSGLVFFGALRPKKHLAGWQIVKYYFAVVAALTAVAIIIVTVIHRLTFDLGIGMGGCLILFVVLAWVAHKEVSLQTDT